MWRNSIYSPLFLGSIHPGRLRTVSGWTSPSCRQERLRQKVHCEPERSCLKDGIISIYDVFNIWLLFNWLVSTSRTLGSTSITTSQPPKKIKFLFLNICNVKKQLGGGGANLSRSCTPPWADHGCWSGPTHQLKVYICCTFSWKYLACSFWYILSFLKKLTESGDDFYQIKKHTNNLYSALIHQYKLVYP